MSESKPGRFFKRLFGFDTPQDTAGNAPVDVSPVDTDAADLAVDALPEPEIVPDPLPVPSAELPLAEMPAAMAAEAEAAGANAPHVLISQADIVADADSLPEPAVVQGAAWLEPLPLPAVLHQAEPPGAAVEAPPVPAPAGEGRSWWQRLRQGLSRTSGTIGTSVTDLFRKRKLDAATLEDLEDILIQADLGVDASARIARAVGEGRYDKEIAPQEVKAILAREVEAILQPVAKPLEIAAGHTPFVILMVGVNGAGKTTTIGKLSKKFRDQGKTVMLAAGDTFRAAAMEQLQVWGERVGAPVITRPQGADAAGLAFDAYQEAKAKGTDILLIDTAGRLQNKTGLMQELEKIRRVIAKVDASAPHAVLLVLDATVGQNALSQVEIFGKVAGVTGLVMTKLDGTARGGILVALAQKTGLPVHFIGVGEGVEDLEPFAAADFARAIAGLE